MRKLGDKYNEYLRIAPQAVDEQIIYLCEKGKLSLVPMEVLIAQTKYAYINGNRKQYNILYDSLKAVVSVSDAKAIMEYTDLKHGRLKDE